MGDMKNPAPPGIPGDTNPRSNMGGISKIMSVMEIGMCSRRVAEIVISSMDMLAQLLLSTVPNTMETSAISRRSPRSCSAETMFTARVSYDPPVPKPVGQTAAK